MHTEQTQTWSKSFEQRLLRSTAAAFKELTNFQNKVNVSIGYIFIKKQWLREESRWEAGLQLYTCLGGAWSYSGGEGY